MASPTRLPTSPTLSDNSTVVLSPDRDRPSRSPDHGEHAPTSSDRPRSPRHPGPAGSISLPGSTDQGERIPAVLDQPGFPVSSIRSNIYRFSWDHHTARWSRSPLSPRKILLAHSIPVHWPLVGLFVGPLQLWIPTSTSRVFPPKKFVLRWRRSRIYGIERPHSAAKRIPSTRFSNHTERLLLAEITCKKRSTICTDRPPHLLLSFIVVTT